MGRICVSRPLLSNSGLSSRAQLEMARANGSESLIVCLCFCLTELSISPRHLQVLHASNQCLGKPLDYNFPFPIAV